MKTKNRLSVGEDFVSTKKKHSKCHDKASRQSKQFDTGIVTDRERRLIDVGTWVSFPFVDNVLECEVTEIHPENMITIIHDDLNADSIQTYKVNAWDVTII